MRQQERSRHIWHCCYLGVVLYVEITTVCTISESFDLLQIKASTHQTNKEHQDNILIRNSLICMLYSSVMLNLSLVCDIKTTNCH